MQVTANVRLAKLLVESAREAVRDVAKGATFQLSFSIAMDLGEVNDSETLSVLEKLSGAISKFEGDAKMQLILNTVPVNELEAKLLSQIEDSFAPHARAENARQAPKLVGADGKAISGQE